MKEYLQPCTYLTGVLLGVNAINDGYLWIDSPDCFFMKVDHIQGNHDINSTLRMANGEHRILTTISDADNVIDNRNPFFNKTLSNICSRDFTKLIFVSSMPMSQLVGVDYGGLINDIKVNYPNKSIFNIPSRSMSECWLDGYADLLFSLAKNIDISGAKPSSYKVAIVGNLFDRNEGDAIGNIEELNKIFNGLGLEVVSIWLNGGKYEDILKIKEAGTIISLPYGRKAAKKIANRLGIGLLELDLPFGLNNTIDFIKKIGSYFEMDTFQIESFIKMDLLDNNIGIVRNIIHSMLFGKTISFYGDPYLSFGIKDFCETFGMNLNRLFIHGEEKHLKNIISPTDKLHFEYILNNESLRDDIFVSIRNSRLKIDENDLLEFGFPSYSNHYFINQPYYGIKGSLNFINRIFNKLAVK